MYIFGRTYRVEHKTMAEWNSLFTLQALGKTLSRYYLWILQAIPQRVQTSEILCQPCRQ